MASERACGRACWPSYGHRLCTCGRHANPRQKELIHGDINRARPGPRQARFLLSTPPSSAAGLSTTGPVIILDAANRTEWSSAASRAKHDQRFCNDGSGVGYVLTITTRPSIVPLQALENAGRQLEIDMHRRSPSHFDRAQRPLCSIEIIDYRLRRLEQRRMLVIGRRRLRSLFQGYDSRPRNSPSRRIGQ